MFVLACPDMLDIEFAELRMVFDNPLSKLPVFWRRSSSWVLPSASIARMLGSWSAVATSAESIPAVAVRQPSIELVASSSEAITLSRPA